MIKKILRFRMKEGSHKRGFTLIELLIVIAIIAVLASVVFVALDPLTRFQDARDSSRWSDVTALLSAIKVDQVDNGGAYLPAITSATDDVEYMISDSTGASGCNLTCDVPIAGSSDCIDLSGLVTEGYIGEVPVSSIGTGSWTTTHTGYYIIKAANGTLTIGACESENSDDISVTR